MDTGDELTSSLSAADREALRQLIYDKTRKDPIVGKTTVRHVASSWTWRALDALAPPYPGARVQFILKSRQTRSGYASSGWNPIPGMSAGEAFREFGFAISKLSAVVYDLGTS